MKGEPTLMGKDIAILDGKIAKVADFIDDEAVETIDATDRVIVPTFMDTHMHIDKAYTMKEDETISLIAACSNSDRHDIEYFGWTDEQIFDHIMDNSSRVVENAISHGTTLIKTNLLFTPTWKTIALDAMLELKKKYKGYCDIKTLVSYPDEYREELLQATKEGKVDFVAGYPHLTPNTWSVQTTASLLLRSMVSPLIFIVMNRIQRILIASITLLRKRKKHIWKDL